MYLFNKNYNLNEIINLYFENITTNSALLSKIIISTYIYIKPVELLYLLVRMIFCSNKKEQNIVSKIDNYDLELEYNNSIDTDSEVETTDDEEDDFDFELLYDSIFQFNMRYLPKYTSEHYLNMIPDYLDNGTELKLIDKYIYAVLMKLAYHNNKKHTFKKFVANLEMLNVHTMSFVLNNIHQIQKEYNKFIENRKKLNKLNCYVFKDDTVKFKLSNNRFIITK
jgi:hypothetical protein